MYSNKYFYYKNTSKEISISVTIQLQKSSTLVVYDDNFYKDADVIFRRSKSLQSPSSDAVSTKFPSLEKKLKKVNFYWWK
jgi:hypothetical protein